MATPKRFLIECRSCHSDAVQVRRVVSGLIMLECLDCHEEECLDSLLDEAEERERRATRASHGHDYVVGQMGMGR